MAPKKERLAGWGNYPTSEAQVTRPRNVEELAGTSGGTELLARGLGRSYGDQALNAERFVADCTAMNHFLDWDNTNGILTCEAGVSLEEIITTFGPKGWFPMICPGTKFVTVGGAIANDVHGKAHHLDGSFVNSVLSFTILLADGSVITASREEHADLFAASFGGLGLLGVILTVRLQLRKIETTYFRQQAIPIRDLDHMLDSLNETEDLYNYSVAWIDPLAKGKKLGSGVLTLGNAARLDELPVSLKKAPLKIHSGNKISLPVFLPSFSLNSLTSRILNRIISYVQSSGSEFVHYDKFFFPLDAIGHWNRAYGKRGFIQYQFLVPDDRGTEALREILEMIVNSGCTPFLNVFKKMGKGHGHLSFPFEGYTLAIDFPVTKALLAFTPKLDQKVLEAGGRLYLGKDALLEKEMFRKMYPQYRQWLKIKDKYDPEHHFTSDIARRLGLFGDKNSAHTEELTLF